MLSGRHFGQLQFGHDVSVVENSPTSSTRSPFSCGFNLATTSASWRTPAVGPRGAFRGTASIWPRRQRRGERPGCGAGRLRSRGFNLATTSASWRTRDTSRGRSRTGGFNLATTSASWRTHLRRGDERPRQLASIWPRRQRRGEPRPLTSVVSPASKLQFGHDVSVVENLGPPSGPSARAARFNLATTSASWRTYRPLAVQAGGVVLQFGHDVSVVENVAEGEQVGDVLEASIWPRRQRRGEQPPCNWGCRSRTWLQFGHDVSVVENRPAQVRRPRRSGRFNLATTSASWRTGWLGDLSCPTRERFNLATTSASWRTHWHGIAAGMVLMLQFGHDVSVVENWVAGGPATGGGALQFGHDVSVVENGVTPVSVDGSGQASIWPRRQRRGEPRCSRSPCPAGAGFNLATTSASWRTPSATRRRPRKSGFNLATTSASWRTGRLVDTPIAAYVASIWPRRQRRGERDVVFDPFAGSGSFNLATTSASWRTATLTAAGFTGRQWLQFGHDVSVVENFAPADGLDEIGGASIWPRRQRRGERIPKRSGRVRGVASIWPRRQRRGEPRRTNT